MPEFSNTPPAAHQISLLLHTAVDFGLNSGVGIGIIQSTVPDVGLPFTLPTEEQAHGIERGQARAKNLRTPERAHMFALILAMGLARSTIRRKCTATRIKMQSTMILCSLPAVVELIKHHQAHGPKSLESVVSKEDRSMIRRVLASVRRLSRYDVQVSIVENGAEGDIGKATRAKMIVSHRKKRPLRRRRHERRIISKNTEMADDEEEDGGSDKEGMESTMGRKDNNSSYPGHTIAGESSGVFVRDVISEPELH